MNRYAIKVPYVIDVNEWKVIWDDEYVKEKKTDRNVLEELKLNMQRFTTDTSGFQKKIYIFLLFFGFFCFVFFFVFFC